MGTDWCALGRERFVPLDIARPVADHELSHRSRNGKKSLIPFKSLFHPLCR